MKRLASAELEGLEGAQVRRCIVPGGSRATQLRARGEGVKLTLILKSGIEAPVNRPNIRPLREAGWY
jgi:hypothetical protein